MVYDFIHIPGIERRKIHDSNFITRFWSLVFLLVWICLFMKMALGFMQVNCINL